MEGVTSSGTSLFIVPDICMSKVLKILICDDSMTIRKKLIQSLTAIAPCEIFEAQNGLVAVTSYEQNRPDLVFMDIMMPEKDGLAAVEEIIAFDSKAKIVMLSSVGTKGNLKKALEGGAMDFIQKPCEEEKLRSLLNSFDTKE